MNKIREDQLIRRRSIMNKRSNRYSHPKNRHFIPNIHMHLLVLMQFKCIKIESILEKNIVYLKHQIFQKWLNQIQQKCHKNISQCVVATRTVCSMSRKNLTISSIGTTWGRFFWDLARQNSITRDFQFYRPNCYY